VTKPFDLVVLGATGAAGRTVLQVLEDRDTPVKRLRLLASERSAGTSLEFRGEEVRVEAVKDGAFRGYGIALFFAGPDVARAWAPKAWADGCVVVDRSWAFRRDADVPLVVPELNADALAGARTRGVVALPGASATALALALRPLAEAAGLERVVATSFESASGVGQCGVEQLERELFALMNMQEPEPPGRIPHRTAFNLVPQVGAFGAEGATEDEERLVDETRRLLGAPSLAMSTTAVRVPLFHTHSLSVNLVTERPLDANAAREILRKAPGVKVVDDPANAIYPMPLLAAAEDAVLAGRIRRDPSHPRGLALFLVIENLRKGAATNAVQVAELLAEKGQGAG
jgi:aspartate-semialdehyde dehydrogenase